MRFALAPKRSKQFSPVFRRESQLLMPHKPPFLSTRQFPSIRRSAHVHAVLEELVQFLQEHRRVDVGCAVVFGHSAEEFLHLPAGRQVLMPSPGLPVA